MKRKILINYNKILAFTLSILGIGSACTFMGCAYGTLAEYGSPSATYKVYGKITTENDQEIPGVRVVLRKDTALSDTNGFYNVATDDFPGDQIFEIQFSDIDGDTNGKLQTKDTTVTFIDPQFEDGDNSWYHGETSKKFNIKLKEED